VKRDRPHPDPHHHTAPVELEDPRDALALPAEENADLCAGCVKCCTYIAVEVDAPRAAWEYDQWIWALHHQGIELYVERPERWYLHVEARCRQLNSSGRCDIYGRHPVLCREYDPRSCERRLPLADVRAWFKSAEALEEWIQRERPAHWRQLQRYRKPQATQARPDSGTAPAFVALASLMTPAAGRPTGRLPAQRPSVPPSRRRAFQSASRRKASSGVS
jgi:Fe-S-cluster containining protein